MIVASSPLHSPSTYSSVNVPVEPPLPSTAMRYWVPATAGNEADVAPAAHRGQRAEAAARVHRDARGEAAGDV